MPGSWRRAAGRASGRRNGCATPPGRGTGRWPPRWAGGTATELLADHAARLAPLTDQDVHDLLTAPRCAPAPRGAAGHRPVDPEGLQDVLSRVSRLATDLPQLAEADLNPLVARPDGVLAVDVRIRLVPRRAWDPYLRRLR